MIDCSKQTECSKSASIAVNVELHSKKKFFSQQPLLSTVSYCMIVLLNHMTGDMQVSVSDCKGVMVTLRMRYVIYLQGFLHPLLKKLVVPPIDIPILDMYL